MIDLSKQIADRLLKLLDDEGTNWRRNWCSQGEQINFVTTKPFRGANQFLLGVANAPSPYWATYLQFQSASLQVARGMKASRIVFFKPYPVHEPESESESEKEEERRAFLPRAITVFNLSQLSNPPELKMEQRPEVERYAEADNVIKKSGIKINFGSDKALYSASDDVIAMPPPEKFHSMEHYYSTAFHELSYAAGHPTRVDRKSIKRFGTEVSVLEQLAAEISVAFLCVKIGIVPPPRPESAEYLNEWKAFLKADKSDVLPIFGYAQRVTDFLLQQQVASTPRLGG